MFSRKPEHDFPGSEVLGEVSGELPETPRTLENDALA